MEQRGRAQPRSCEVQCSPHFVCAPCSFSSFNIGMYGSRAWEDPARANAKLAIAASETAAALPPGLVAC